MAPDRRALIGLRPGNPTRWSLARLLAFALALCALFVTSLLLAPHSAPRLRHELAGLGAWVPVAAVAVYALAACSFVPGAVLAGASGLLFGTGLGTAVAVVSATLGAAIAFLVARAMARRSFSTLARGRLQAWTDRVGQHGFLAILYARAVPGAPFALVSYASGMTRIKLRDFAAATAIVALPRAFAYAALGGSIDNYSSPQALIAIGIIAAMAIGGTVMLWRARSRSKRRNVVASEGVAEP